MNRFYIDKFNEDVALCCEVCDEHMYEFYKVRMLHIDNLFDVICNGCLKNLRDEIEGCM